MTEREIFKTILAHKLPPRFPKDDTIQLSFIPGEHSMEPKGGLDWFGVFWVKEADGTQTVMPGTTRIESMEDWKDVMPTVREDEMRYWGEKTSAGYDRENKIQIVGIQSGHFERMQSLVSFEDALTAFYEYPDEVMEFFDAMTDFKIEEFRQIKKYYDPDIVSPHDDWGMNTNMFFSPQTWRKFIKPQLKRMVDACHELGMLYEQHTCGYITPIVEDMVECGVDMCEIQAVNDLKYIKDNFGDKLVLRGCINGQKLSAPTITVEKAHEEVRAALEILGRGGGFIAQNVWGSKPEIMQAVQEEYDRFSKENYK